LKIGDRGFATAIEVRFWPIAPCCTAAEFRSQMGRSGHSASPAPKITLPLSAQLAFKSNKSAREEIQNLVATLIGKARRQFNGQMFSPRMDATAHDTRPLRVFLAGGGANSAWYKSAIEDTFIDRNLQQWGLTGIKAEIVSRPANYSGNDFPRFVIALGLADPNTALADAQLPSQIPNADPLPIRPMTQPITKDLV
jgi:hypothetical protein